MPTFGTAADDEVVSLHEQYYIQATSSRADDRTRVLKHDEMFAVFDRFGDVQPVGLGEQGIYHDGTRFLSRLELRLGGRRPLLLSSTVKKENDLLTVDLATPDLKDPTGQLVLPRGTLHVFRTKFLWRSCCYERLRVSNFATTAVDVELALSFNADYADIFEVRGAKRERRGVHHDPVVDGASVILSYEGLDRVVRRTRLAFDPAPDELTGGHARFHLRLPARGTSTIYFKLSCDDGGDCAELDYDRACAALATSVASGQLSRCRVRAPGSEMDEWIARSVSDLEMMITTTPQGPYPYAGVPWYSTPFGRDGIITALEVLWLAPEIARGVLGYLAANQATAVAPARDAEPGKILHEARGGEMAALGEVPFGRYYGSVDATPLFVILAAAHHRRTGDLAFLKSIAPSIQRAVDWIERYGDADGDGFVEYARQTPIGLLQQGWKDSHDSVFHEDGTLAEPPIALVEVQAYVFGAWQAAAEIAIALGGGSGDALAKAESYLRKAEAMRARFEARFWDEQLGCYVLALDGTEAPLPGRQLERRARAVDGDRRRSGARARRGRGPDARRELLRLGHPDDPVVAGPLQPDGVPQRLGVAARQRDHRRRVRALRLPRSGGPGARRDEGRERRRRHAPVAGADLRVLAPPGRGADAVSGRVRAAGVGVGRGVHAAGGGAGPVRRRPHQRHHAVAAR